ncbi:MAG: hypothetical protein JNL94_03365 [Planctomycetes bacterium]|nr:hypothetical protein [Planctomycetota bacterium]
MELGAEFDAERDLVRERAVLAPCVDREEIGRARQGLPDPERIAVQPSRARERLHRDAAGDPRRGRDDRAARLRSIDREVAGLGLPPKQLLAQPHARGAPTGMRPERVEIAQREQQPAVRPLFVEALGGRDQVDQRVLQLARGLVRFAIAGQQRAEHDAAGPHVPGFELQRSMVDAVLVRQSLADLARSVGAIERDPMIDHRPRGRRERRIPRPEPRREERARGVVLEVREAVAEPIVAVVTRADARFERRVEPRQRAQRSGSRRIGRIGEERRIARTRDRRGGESEQ